MAIVNDCSKPNWIWFGICVLQNHFFSFQTKLELVWKIVIFGWNFSKPNWIWFGKGHWIKCSCTALLLSSLPSSFTLNKVQKIYIEKVASPVESTLVNGASSLITGLSKLLYHKTNTTFAIKILNSEPHHCDQDYPCGSNSHISRSSPAGSKKE